MGQMIVLTKPFVPYDHLDLHTILKATAAIYNLNLADLNCGKSLLQASYQAVLGVLLFASLQSTNMQQTRSL